MRTYEFRKHNVLIRDNNLVEVFKTNVEDEEDAVRLIENLTTMLPDCKINFDLQDCDKILRIAGKSIEPDSIINVINSKGYFCEVLN